MNRTLMELSNEITEYYLLYVEDDRMMQEILVEYNKHYFNEHLKIITTSDIEEVETVVKEISFDVVLLDLGLRTTDGIGSFDALSSIVGNIPIVIFTSLVDSSVKNVTLSRGAKEYIIKGDMGYHDLLILLHETAKEYRKIKAQHKESSAEFNSIIGVLKQTK